MSKELKRKKVSVKNVKLSAQEVGFSFQGKYQGISKGQPFEKVGPGGEVVTSQLQSVIIEQDGERIAYLADKGLIQNLNDAMVNVGDLIEVVKLDKVSIGKGRTMNQYDIFLLS